MSSGACSIFLQRQNSFHGTKEVKWVVPWGPQKNSDLTAGLCVDWRNRQRRMKQSHYCLASSLFSIFLILRQRLRTQRGMAHSFWGLHTSAYPIQSLSICVNFLQEKVVAFLLLHKIHTFVISIRFCLVLFGCTAHLFTAYAFIQ